MIAHNEWKKEYDRIVGLQKPTTIMDLPNRIYTILLEKIPELINNYIDINSVYLCGSYFRGNYRDSYDNELLRHWKKLDANKNLSDIDLFILPINPKITSREFDILQFRPSKEIGLELYNKEKLNFLKLFLKIFVQNILNVKKSS